MHSKRPFSFPPDFHTFLAGIGLIELILYSSQTTDFIGAPCGSNDSADNPTCKSPGWTTNQKTNCSPYTSTDSGCNTVRSYLYRNIPITQCYILFRSQWRYDDSTDGELVERLLVMRLDVRF